MTPKVTLHKIQIPTKRHRISKLTIALRSVFWYFNSTESTDDNFRFFLKRQANFRTITTSESSVKKTKTSLRGLTETHVSSRIFFSATVLPFSLSFALYTTPYVPSPIFSSLRKASIGEQGKMRGFLAKSSVHSSSCVSFHYKQTSSHILRARLLHWWLVDVSRVAKWLALEQIFPSFDWLK